MRICSCLKELQVSVVHVNHVLIARSYGQDRFDELLQMQFTLKRTSSESTTKGCVLCMFQEHPISLSPSPASILAYRHVDGHAGQS